MQLPSSNCPTSSLIATPPEPQPFHAPVVRKCIQHRARVQHHDPRRPDTMEEIFILTSMSLSVKDMLHDDTDAGSDKEGHTDGDDD